MNDASKQLWEKACVAWAQAEADDDEIEGVKSAEFLRKLASDGYDIHNEVTDRLTAKLNVRLQILIPPDQIMWVRQTAPVWGEMRFSPRTPNAASLAIRDSVQETVQAFRYGHMLPPGLELEVSPVQRMTADGEHTTVVLVHVKPPMGGIRTIIVETEA